jgi:hypothetical protein
MAATSSPPGEAVFVPPYPASWIDRLTTALERAPGPTWLVLAVLALAAVLLQWLIQRSVGAYRPGPYLPLQVWMTVNFAYFLAMILYLDRAAAAALEAFRPVLDTPSREPDAGRPPSSYLELRYRLTTLPARPTLWATFLGGAVLVLVPMVFLRSGGGESSSLMGLFTSFGYSSSVIGLTATLLQFIFNQAVGAVVVYHTIHQLRLINHIYLRRARVNLYRLQPLYAFSVPTAMTAGALLLYTYAWFGSSPVLLLQPVSVSLGIFFGGIALVTFAWPLWGIHRRLVQEKKRLLEQSSARFEAAVSQLHERVDAQQLERMDDLNKTLSSLEIEQAALRRVPTWPWEPGTVRGLVAALLVPILIWLTQSILQRLMG